MGINIQAILNNKNTRFLYDALSVFNYKSKLMDKTNYEKEIQRLRLENEALRNKVQKLQAELSSFKGQDSSVNDKRQLHPRK